MFAEWVLQTGRDPGLVVIDSVKDMLISADKNDGGQAFNAVIQALLAKGTDTLAIHHPRKPTGDNPKPNALGDVYGSAWITAGHGSVLLLWGEAGASSVELSQLKPVRELVKPIIVNFNRFTGGAEGGDARMILLNLASTAEPIGFTLDAAVSAVYKTGRADRTWRSHSQKLRRFLGKLVDDEELDFVEGSKGGAVPNRWTLHRPSSRPPPRKVAEAGRW